MKIIFRTDSSYLIGTGHVMRCLALAEHLTQDQGVTVEFVCRDHRGSIHSFIQKEKGYKVTLLPPINNEQPPSSFSRPYDSWLGVTQSQDSNDFLSALEGQVPDWVVADHYGISSEWESAIGARGAKILVIDDLRDRAHDCDILLDQGLSASGAVDYRDAGLISKRTELLSGPRFALLRSEFAEKRQIQRVRSGELKHILVYFGGVDLTGETLKTVRALLGLKELQFKTDVVVGPSNKSHQDIVKLVGDEPDIKISSSGTGLSDQMLKADLFIGAGGGTTWERACLGLPSLVISIAENQVSTARAMAEDAYHIYLGQSDEVDSTVIGNAVKQLKANPPLLRCLSRRSLTLTDGNGARRVAHRILHRNIKLRSVTQEDCEQIYQWRTAKENRENSFQTQTFSIESHRKWFSESLRNPRRVLWIAEVDEARPVGFIRFDMEESVATVSIYMVPGHHGQGWAVPILKSGAAKLAQDFKNINVIRAEVKTSNKASLNAFSEAGYIARNFLLEANIRS